nr:MAG TPA: hypothetical protein [Caudoviricetes sp.]
MPHPRWNTDGACRKPPIKTVLLCHYSMNRRQSQTISCCKMRNNSDGGAISWRKKRKDPKE